MKLYENVFVARQELSPAQVEELTKTITEIVQQQEGTVHKSEYSGLIELAFPIRKNTKGHFVLMNLTATPEAITELERRLRLNENVIRFMTIAVEKHQEGVSPLTQHARYQNQRLHYRADDKKPDSSKARNG